MPIIPTVINTCDRIKELHKKKNDDYANEGNPFYNFDVQEYFISQVKNERDKVFTAMLGLKFGRLCNLINQNGQTNNESLEESFDDFATYIILWKADRDRRKKVVTSRNVANPELEIR